MCGPRRFLAIVVQDLFTTRSFIMAAYLKYGTTIKGESLAEGHKGSDGWIEIGSVQWGCGRAISTPVGASSKREASAPSVSEITVTKLMDSTSPKLCQETLIGKAVEATIELVETGDAKLETYLTLKLTNCMIAGYSFSSGGGRPSESLSLNFTKIEYTYQGYDDQHKVDTAKKASVTYDLTTAQNK
jgi:type VI secretion system secreted protein Hcp